MRATLMITGPADIAALVASIAGDRPVTVLPSGTHLIKYKRLVDARAAVWAAHEAVKINGQKMLYDEKNGTLIFGEVEISILK